MMSYNITSFFYDFLVENRFLPIFVDFQLVENFEVALTILRHSDVIRRRMGIYVYYRNPEGFATTPFGGRVKKLAQEDEG